MTWEDDVPDAETVKAHPLRALFLLLLMALVFVALIVFGAAGCREYGRWQQRADARNRTSITKQEIKTAAQRAKVNIAQIAATKAEAKKRIAEAHGIRVAQDLISKTLTPMYVQHEAIQAQKLTAGGDRTIYIPVGPQGVPMVANVNGNAVGAAP